MNTIVIEQEAVINTADTASTAEQPDDPLFGMWRAREEMADVEAYVRELRAPRF